MDRRSPSSKVLISASLLLTALALQPNTQAQTLADYASRTAHVVVGSASGVGNTVFGGQVASAVLPFAPDAVADKAGNLYFLNISSGAEVDILYVADVDGAPPGLLTLAANHADSPFNPLVKGSVYRVAGEADIACQPGSTCRDGGYAVNATIGYGPGLAFDAAGNLYIAEQNSFCIRKVSASDGKISTIVGDPMHATAGISGDGGDASQALLTGPVQLTFDTAGNLYIVDNGANVVRRVGTDNKIATIAGVPAASPYTFCSDADFSCGEGGLATSATLGGVYGVAVNSQNEVYISESSLQVVRKIDAQGNLVTVAGTRGQPCNNATCGDGGAATSAMLNNPFGIVFDSSDHLVIGDGGDDVVRGVQDGTIVTMAGTINQAPAFDVGQAVTFDGKPASQLPLSLPYKGIFDSQRNLYTFDEISLIWKIDAPVSKLSQTIDFETPSAVTYGTAPVTLTARSLDASSNPTALPITYTATPVSLVTVNGSTLTIKGAGEISITASQPGDTTYAAATAVTRTLTVQKAPLTVKADDLSFVFNSGSSLPKLTYRLTGLVNGDTASTAVTGTPVLQTTATPTSSAGQYPITIGVGTLASVNYELNLQDGILTVTGGLTQTITFNALPDVTYGAPAISLAAVATSGLPIAYTVSGPANILGSRLVVNGVGTVSVTANQAGNLNYGPAPAVTRSFQVKPATLTITANNATRQYNQPDAPFSYTATGFVNGDTTAVLSGTPVYLPPAANAVPGQYALGFDPSGGTLFAQNYSFRFVPGTLTVTKATQVISFAQIPDTAYGTQGVLWNATSSSGLPVTVAASGPIRYNALAFDAIPADGIPRIGTVTATATQAGNDLYAPATPVTQTFQTVKTLVQVHANTAFRAFGSPNPEFTYFLGGSSTDVIPANAYSGVPQLTTTAKTDSPPGDYPIVVTPGTLQSPVFHFTFLNSTLTVLPKSSFTLTANPSTLTVTRGQSASLKLTLTPINDFSGSVTVNCANLPQGVNCVLNPQALTPTTSGAVTGPASGVLTITTTGASASLKPNGKPNGWHGGKPGDESDSGGLFTAGLLWLPGGLGGLLLLFARKRLAKSLQAQRMLLLTAVLLGLSSFVACGGSSKSGGSAQPGTETIQIVGTGTAPDGSQVVNQLDLTITVQ